jgi:hypothetical protein
MQRQADASVSRTARPLQSQIAVAQTVGGALRTALHAFSFSQQNSLGLFN